MPGDALVKLNFIYCQRLSFVFNILMNIRFIILSESI